MIKKIKLGFSLAELLIALAIISVIATMGFTLTKKNIEKAYDLYLYTGYEALHYSILDANMNGLDFKSMDTTALRNFTTHITSIIGKKNSNLTITNNNQDYEFTATNGTVYNIRYIGCDANNVCGAEIKMTVPYKKTRKDDGTISNTISTCFGYFPQKDYSIMLPLTTDTCGADLDLRRRIDLLPFYIDDGIVGRANGGTYTARNFYSAHDAICNIFSGAINYKGIAQYDCSTPANKIIGVAKPITPRKIR